VVFLVAREVAVLDLLLYLSQFVLDIVLLVLLHGLLSEPLDRFCLLLFVSLDEVGFLSLQGGLRGRVRRGLFGGVQVAELQGRVLQALEGGGHLAYGALLAVHLVQHRNQLLVLAQVLV